MEIIAIELLVAGVLSTAIGIIAEEMSMLIFAGVFYLCCGVVIARMSKERGLVKMTENRASPMVKFFCPKCGEKMWEMTNWNTARCYSQDELRVLLVCTDCTLEEIRTDKIKKASK